MIDLNAGQGQLGLAVGDQVTITGRGLYSGERGVIQRFVGTVIPAAVVRTQAGLVRQIRTIDLQAARPEPRT
jgi:hypothetical protein